MTTAPTALRDAGMAAAEAAADPRVLLTVDKVIADAIASREPFSANTIRERLPVTSQGLVGARMNAASMRRPVEMVAVGEEPSNLPSTHGKPIAVWVAVCDAAYGSHPDRCYQPARHKGAHSNRYGTTWKADA